MGGTASSTSGGSLVPDVGTVPDRALAAGVFVTHGLLDTAVTLGVFLATENTGIESNPVVRSMLQDALNAATYPPGDPALLPKLLPAAGLKVGVAFAATVALLYARHRLPRRAWRAWTLSLVALGLLVVGNNLLALRGVAA